MHGKSDLEASLFTSTPSERRAAAQRLEQERAEARRRELDEQTSMNNHPRDRIKIWERLHALALPTSQSHPLVKVIAAQTHLSVGDVRAEQERRRGANNTEQPAV